LVPEIAGGLFVPKISTRLTALEVVQEISSGAQMKVQLVGPRLTFWSKAVGLKLKEFTAFGLTFVRFIFVAGSYINESVLNEFGKLAE
jgi:hypothetical protein